MLASTMRTLTTEQLTDLLTAIAASDDDSRDDLLTDFLVASYPTKSTQVN
jgi:hypothetical protein